MIPNKNRLLLEELTDLLFDLNDLWKYQTEVEFTYDEVYQYKLKGAISNVSSLCAILSLIEGQNKTKEEFIMETSNFLVIDSYITVSDIHYLTEKSLDKIKKIENDYYENGYRSRLVEDYLQMCKDSLINCHHWINESKQYGY